MDLLTKTRDICKELNIVPRRGMGQNFLVEENFYTAMIEASRISAKDFVLEVGPGLGFLTRLITEKAGQITTVELDKKIAVYLRENRALADLENLKIIQGDILTLLNKIDLPKEYKIVANLPYNITSRFLKNVYFLDNGPVLMTLMLQKEIAERIVANPPKMSILAISIQLYASPEIIIDVPRTAFWPVPQVDSAIISFKKADPSRIIKNFNKKEKKFFQTVKIGFSAKRKMLKNNLSAGFKTPTREIEEMLLKIGISPKARAQDLSLKDWALLTDVLV
ncbi:16S rRNA (adenine(1518)-N(6)/adenine(1519)-N(6))-dimethyltransferase RsmA [bacterium]|nr:16S rRNA (adenine(1518)-N(6)/adenine(1519)-N(6))-dimethyltransferase RsmA [bacterium]